MALIRAPRVGDGPAVARLWRELWDLHTGWGGYPGTREDLPYLHLAERLNGDFHHRREQILEGAHLHLVAEHNGAVVGQVEGWLENYGVRTETVTTCEVRSLIVQEGAHGLGLGRLLLEHLAQVAVRAAAKPVTLVAEVLERNPAHAFYTHLKFGVLSYSRKLTLEPRARDVSPCTARLAGSKDAFPMGLLHAHLALDRRQRGDFRFDPPAALDASRVSAIAIHLRNQAHNTSAYGPLDYLAEDAAGTPVGAAALMVAPLDPPFLPVRRAALGCFALPNDEHAQAAFNALALRALHDAAAQGARFIELNELVPSTTLPYAVALGTEPWSTIVCKTVRAS